MNNEVIKKLNRQLERIEKNERVEMLSVLWWRSNFEKT